MSAFALLPSNHRSMASPRTQSPFYSRSYYIQDVSPAGMTRLGQDDADWANSQVGTCRVDTHTYQAPSTDYTAIFQFGHINYRNGSYGVFYNLADRFSKFDTTTYFASDSNIEQGVKAYLQGFKAHIHDGTMIESSGLRIHTSSCVRPHLMLGVDNKFLCQGATDPCNTGDAATQWAKLVKDLYFILASDDPFKNNNFGYTVEGAIDAETTFSPGQDITRFIKSFDQNRQNSPVSRLTNYGDVRDYAGQYADLWNDADLKYIMEHTDVVAEYFGFESVNIWNTFWWKHSDIHVNYIGVMTECSPQPAYYHTPIDETDGLCQQNETGKILEFAPMKARNMFLQNAPQSAVPNPSKVQLMTNIEWQPPPM